MEILILAAEALALLTAWVPVSKALAVVFLTSTFRAGACRVLRNFPRRFGVGGVHHVANVPVGQRSQGIELAQLEDIAFRRTINFHVTSSNIENFSVKIASMADVPQQLAVPLGLTFFFADLWYEPMLWPSFDSDSLFGSPHSLRVCSLRVPFVSRATTHTSTHLHYDQLIMI